MEDDGILGAVRGRWHRASKDLQYYSDKSVLHVSRRWIGSWVLALVYGVRVYCAQGFSIVITSALGIYLLYLLNKFLSFHTDTHPVELLPILPIQTRGEGKPHVRRFPEFKLWRSTTTALAIAFLIILFPMFDVSQDIKILVIIIFCWAFMIFTLLQLAFMFRFYNLFTSGESKKIKYGGPKPAASASAASDCDSAGAGADADPTPEDSLYYRVMIQYDDVVHNRPGLLFPLSVPDTLAPISDSEDSTFSPL